MTDELQFLAESAVFDLLEADDTMTTLELHAALVALDAAFSDVTKNFVYRTYKKYEYTFKNRRYKQTHKFTDENLL